MLRVVEGIRSFHRRRIAIPVDRDALVLDVGSGDKPHWRADVLLDRYVDASHGGQRSGRAAARITRPLFDADAAAMPFADDAFDFAICSHLLEHVTDPAAVVAELARVARAGYIEVPEAASAKILDFPSHLWWCRLDGDTLVFTAKTARHFDPEIGAYIERAGVAPRLAKLLDSEFDDRVAALPWSGAPSVRVEGRLEERFVAGAFAADAHHQVGETIASRVLTVLFTLPLRYGPSAIVRRSPIVFDDIVSERFRTGRGDRLERKIYSLESSTSRTNAS